jgi:hypothetical protein
MPLQFDNSLLREISFPEAAFGTALQGLEENAGGRDLHHNSRCNKAPQPSGRRNSCELPVFGSGQASVTAETLAARKEFSKAATNSGACAVL